MAKTKQTYDVIADGWLFGDYYRAGDTIQLHPEQAAQDMPPHGSMLKLSASASPSAPTRSRSATTAAPATPAQKRGQE